MKYIPAEKLIAEIDRRMTENCKLAEKVKCFGDRAVEDNDILALIESLQQDKDVLDLCSRVWWEDRGWIMIPPNVTLKGIESLLERVRHKIKWNEENGIEEQEQPEVNLDSALTEFMSRYAFENGGEYPSAIDIARHFYELGRLNTRKEEIKP